MDRWRKLDGSHHDTPDPASLASLLGMGLETDDGRATFEAEVSMRLRDRLARGLPGISDTGALPPALARLWEAGFETPDHSLASLLLGPGSGDAALLSRAKLLGKELFHQADNEPDRVVGASIYFAAIAAALLDRGECITRHPPTRLADYFQDLAAKSWMPRELALRFEAARAVCAPPDSGGLAHG